MLKVIELAFCCYAVTEMKRARAFYESVLGLKPTTVNNSEHGQWTEYEFGPYALAIGSAPAFKPSADGCTAALEVEDFDKAIEHLRVRSTVRSTRLLRLGLRPQPRSKRNSKP